MKFKLLYRQGSFRREYECAALEEAIRAGGQLLDAVGCSEFHIVSESGQLLLDHEQIAARYRLMQREGEGARSCRS